MACFPSPNAYYAADLATFIGSTSGAILGDITANTAFAVELEQRDAWLTQIDWAQLTKVRFKISKKQVRVGTWTAVKKLRQKRFKKNRTNNVFLVDQCPSSK
jgi:hypothetical protein